MLFEVYRDKTRLMCTEHEECIPPPDIIKNMKSEGYRILLDGKIYKMKGKWVMKYDARKGYGLQFAKFNEDYIDNIIYRETKEEVIRLADIIICSLTKESLMEELNNMQANAYIQDTEGDTKFSVLFEDKFNIPAYFINLLLDKHNMKVLGW